MITVLNLFGLMLLSAQDIRKSEIEPVIPVIMIAITAICNKFGYGLASIKEGMVAAVILFVFFALLGIAGKYGGGDALVSSVMGMSIGYYAVTAVWLALIICLPYTVYMKVKKREHQYPFIPFLAAGYVLVLAYMLAKRAGVA